MQFRWIDLHEEWQMNEQHGFSEMQIGEDDQSQLLPVAKTYKESVDKRDAARLGFQNKMAVLCAGSIAVLASGALAVVNSAALQHRLPAHFAVYVIFAASCLWLSLVCCTAHNYLGIALLEHDSESKMEETLLTIAGIAWKRKGLTEENRRQAIANLPLTKNAKKRTRRGIIVARIQPHLTLAGVALFCIGYLAVIVFICIASSSV
jgi:hypothetical protein